MGGLDRWVGGLDRWVGGEGDDVCARACARACVKTVEVEVKVVVVVVGGGGGSAVRVPYLDRFEHRWGLRRRSSTKL